MSAGGGAGISVRTASPADVERSFDIRSRSFGVLPTDARPGWEANLQRAIAEDRALGAYDGDLLVGRATIASFRQWWGGRVVPMAGIAGVVVSPEYRGRGVGSALMDGAIQRGRELGYPLSALYPATVPVYRSRGWEISGAQYRYTVESRLLRDLRGGPVDVRQATSADAGRLVDLMHEHHASSRVCGVRDRSEDEVREDLGDDSVFAYLADGGYVVYGWEGADLVVYEHLASDADTARALWSVVGSGSSIARQVHAYLLPDDPIHLLIGEAVSSQVQRNAWMLRCLDARTAIAGRGYPLGVTADVAVTLTDAQVHANELTARLSVAGGRGELVVTAADPRAVRLNANGLAALYAGAPVATLVAAGLASGGDPEAHGLLDAAFAGRPATLLDYF